MTVNWEEVFEKNLGYFTDLEIFAADRWNLCPLSQIAPELAKEFSNLAYGQKPSNDYIYQLGLKFAKAVEWQQFKRAKKIFLKMKVANDNDS